MSGKRKNGARRIEGQTLAEGDRDGARVHFERAESVMATLVRQWPDHPGFARDLETVQQAIAALEEL